MQIDYIKKNVYGRIRYYPASDDAKIICLLINAPTLTTKHLKICKDAGWPLNQINKKTIMKNKD